MPRSELLFAFEEGVFDKSSAKLSLTDVSNLIDYGIFFSDLLLQFFDPIFLILDLLSFASGCLRERIMQTFRCTH